MSEIEVISDEVQGKCLRTNAVGCDASYPCSVLLQQDISKIQLPIAQLGIGGKRTKRLSVDSSFRNLHMSSPVKILFCTGQRDLRGKRSPYGIAGSNDRLPAGDVVVEQP